MKSLILLKTIALCSGAILALGTAEAKPGKDKGPKNNPPGQSNKANKGNKPAKDKGKAVPPGQAKKDKVTPSNKPGKVKWKDFTDDDRSSIVNYFAKHKSHPHGLPPGLQKRIQDGKGLPPGWRDKLVPGWIVPNDNWGYFEPVPSAWFPDLPLGDDVGLYLIGDRIARVHSPERRVLDVIDIPTIKLP